MQFFLSLLFLKVCIGEGVWMWGLVVRGRQYVELGLSIVRCILRQSVREYTCVLGLWVRLLLVCEGIVSVAHD